jgi:hypothetical protein
MKLLITLLAVGALSGCVEHYNNSDIEIDGKHYVCDVKADNGRDAGDEISVSDCKVVVELKS